MKKGLLYLLGLSLLSVNLQAQAAIAVANCTVSGFTPAAAYESLAIDTLTAELSRFPTVKALDRRSLDHQLKEMKLSLSGLVDSNSAVEIGGIIEANWILTAGLLNFNNQSTLISAQLINTGSGEVAYAASEIMDGIGLPQMQERIRQIARAVVARLEPGADARAESLWVTRAEGPAFGKNDAKPILIWVMSDGEDAADPHGVWYLGPAQLKPLTDKLKAAGHAVVAHDRRTLARLDQTSLNGYSQIWIIEGDGNDTIDVTSGEIQALRGYYDQGGRIWLSGENSMEAEASWIEDINAFATAFGVRIGQTLILPEPGFSTKGKTGPLFTGVEYIVYDDEIGLLELKDPAFTVLLEAPAVARLIDEYWTEETILRYALRERLQQLNTNPNFSYRWLFGRNFGLIGRRAGPGRAVLALRDERVHGKGMLLIDSGWLIGWTFNGPQGRIVDIGQNSRFLLNVADFYRK